MQQLPGRLISAAILLALIGVALAIPSLFTAAMMMRWASYACGGLAAVLVTIEICIWCSLNLSWRHAVVAMAVAILLPTALIWGLSHAYQSDEQPATGEAADQPGALSRPRDPDGVMEVTLAETRPGYTSETLMQASAGGSQPNDLKYDDVIFEDTTGDGARAALVATGNKTLTFTVTSKNANAYDLDVPLGPGGVPSDENVSLTTEAGNTSKGGYLRALVNGKEVAFRLLGDPLDFGDGDWKPSQRSGRSRLNGILVAAQSRFLAAWALSNGKLAELIANTRAAHRDFFNGDDSILHPPLGSEPDGSSPIAGTFMQNTYPP